MRAGCGEVQEDAGYVVKSGDSLWDIGKRYMVSLDNLKEMNHLTKDEVCAGEKILIIR